MSQHKQQQPTKVRIAPSHPTNSTSIQTSSRFSNGTSDRQNELKGSLAQKAGVDFMNLAVKSQSMTAIKPRAKQNTVSHLVTSRAEKKLEKIERSSRKATATLNRIPEMNPEKMNSRLKKRSPWFQSLVDPCRGGSIKIPDMVGIQTGTLQAFIEYTVTTNSNGVCGLRVYTPYPNTRVNSDAGIGSNYQTTTDASTTTNLQWGNQGAATGGGFNGFPWNPNMSSFAQGVRIVSAGIEATSETTTLTDRGELCGFSIPFRVLGNVDYAALMYAYGSSTVPINSKRPMKALWYPCSMRNSSSGTIDYHDFVDPSLSVFYPNDSTAGVPLWNFGVVGVGLEPGSILKFKVCVNYEFIPRQNVLDIISTSPSPVDLQEEELCLDWMTNEPKTGSISQRSFSQTPTISEVEEPGNGSGFGMFMEVLKELVPYAVKAAPSLLALL